MRTSETVACSSKFGDTGLFQCSDDLVEWRTRLIGSVVDEPTFEVEGDLEHRIGIAHHHLHATLRHTPGSSALAGTAGSPLR